MFSRLARSPTASRFRLPHCPRTIRTLCRCCVLGCPPRPPLGCAGLTIRKVIGDIAAEGAQVLAAIDPTDDLVTASGTRARHRGNFLTELRDALHADPRLHLLVIGRDQTIAAVAKVLGHGRQYKVPALSWQATVDAVTGQFAAAGRRLADGAAENLRGRPFY